MPPRKGPRNVVKSGNAGNSSKSSPLPSTTTQSNEPASQKGKTGAAAGGNGGVAGSAGGEAIRPPPLFPVGYKSPITILNEKCQKEGWERPLIDSVRPSSLSTLPNSTPRLLTSLHHSTFHHSTNARQRRFQIKVPTHRHTPPQSR